MKGFYNVGWFASVVLFLLSGCVSVTDIIKMELETDQKKIIKNVATLNEILEEERDDPEKLSVAMKVSVVSATKNIDLKTESPIDYNLLLNNLNRLWEKPPKPEDESDWTNDGYKVEETKNYLAAYAVHSITKLNPKNSTNKMLEILKKTDPNNMNLDIIRIAAMAGLIKNIDRIRSDNSMKERVLSTLAYIYRPSREEKKPFMNSFRLLEESVANFETINSVLLQHRTLIPEQPSLQYVLSLNERVWLKHIKNNISPELLQAKRNISLLISFSNPLLEIESERFKHYSRQEVINLMDDVYSPEENSIARDNRERARNFLTNYIPNAYVYGLLLTSKFDDNTLLELLGTIPLAREYDLVAKNNEKRPFPKINRHSFINHNSIFGDEFQKDLFSISKKLFFDSLHKRIPIQKATYQMEFLSLLFQFYQIEFSEYLTQFLQTDFQKSGNPPPISHIIRMAYYATQYSYLETFEKKRLNELFESLFLLTENQSSYFDQSQHTSYIKKVGPFLSWYNPKRHIVMCANMSEQLTDPGIAERFKNIQIFTELCLKSLEDPKNFEIDEKYWLAIGKAFRMHDMASNNLLTGFFLKRDIRSWLDLYLEQVFESMTESQKVTWYDYYLLGQIFQKNRAELPKSYDRKVMDVFLRGVKNPDDNISLSALRYAFSLAGETGEGEKHLKKILRTRWKEIVIPESVFNSK